MKSFLRIVYSRHTVKIALRVALVVGTVLNVINQGEEILAGNNISLFHLLLNYLVPYCVASYSAAKNEISRKKDD